MCALEIRHANYDRGFDVLRLLFPLPKDMVSYDEECFPGIIVSRSETDERITGITVLDYSKRPKRELKTLVPNVPWEKVEENIL